MTDASSPRRTDYQASDNESSQNDNTTLVQLAHHRRKNSLPDFQDGFRDDLRAKHPRRAKRAAASSKAAAIELQCLECIGGSAKDAINCETQGCFLWPHAFGRAKSVRFGGER